MNNKDKSKIPEGVTILAFSLYGYMAVYFYELGFCRAYGIPIELINPSLSNFLAVGGISLGILGFLYQVLNLFHLVVNQKLPDSPYRTLLSKHGLFVILGILVVIQSYFYWGAVVFFLIFPILYLLADVIPPIFDGGDSYSEKLAHWLDFQRKNPDKSLINDAINKDNAKPILIAIFGIYTLAVLANFGYGEALRKERFSVAGEYAILKVYGTQGIAAKFDEKNKEVLPEYKIIDMSSAEFKIMELGELRKKSD